MNIPTNTCESKISCLKRLNNYLRTSQVRLRSLEVLQIQQSMPIDFDQVIVEYVSEWVGGNIKLPLK